MPAPTRPREGIPTVDLDRLRESLAGLKVRAVAEIVGASFVPTERRCRWLIVRTRPPVNNRPDRQSNKDERANHAAE